MIPFLDIKKINEAYQPELGQAISRVVECGNYIRGEEVRRFEERYADYTGTQWCVGVGNGFDALRLVLKAWILRGELHEGDEVIVPSNTYIASILAIIENRLTPVLVEPDLVSFTSNAENIERKITRRTRVIMVVHLYGRNAFDPAIRAMAIRHRLKILEDNAQATGCVNEGKRTGALGDAAAHSFFPTKNLGAVGDGGAVTTDDRDLADMIRTLGNYGSPKKGVNSLPGVNSRLDEIQAAALNVKLGGLEGDNARRRATASYYIDTIRHPAIFLPGHTSDPLEHVWHLFVIRCKHRDALQQYLRENGIETLVHYPVPPHQQPAYKGVKDLHLPVSEQIHREVLSLPLNPAVHVNESIHIADVLNGFRGGAGGVFV